VAETTALVPWYGSNRILAKHVGAELAGCKWLGVPFAGSCCELLYCDARTIVVNDLHRHLCNLVRVVADPKLGPALYRKLRRVVLHPDLLAQAQERCAIREEPVGFEVEADAIRRALRYAGGNRLRAAEVLQIHRNTLAKKIQEYGLDQERPNAQGAPAIPEKVR
jgi:transcriptional regulator with GAF, ATPase, and Fis domain